MAALDLKYITKDLNPPNAPKCCPIKKYCSALKQKVWANNWSAKNPEQLIQKIKLCAKKIESSIYQNLFVNLKSKMRCAAKMFWNLWHQLLDALHHNLAEFLCGRFGYINTVHQSFYSLDNYTSNECNMIIILINLFYKWILPNRSKEILVK